MWEVPHSIDELPKVRDSLPTFHRRRGAVRDMAGVTRETTVEERGRRRQKYPRVEVAAEGTADSNPGSGARIALLSAPGRSGAARTDHFATWDV